MDYRYYQGDPLIKFPPWMRTLAPWFKSIGIGMCIFSLVFPFLMIIHVIESTFFLNCLAFVFNTYGILLWVYGFSLRKVNKIEDEELSEAILDYYNQKRKKIQ
jgi:hypothetical protein